MLALDPQVLDDAAGRIDAVAASLTCLDVASPLVAVGEGMSGSVTADACRWVATEIDAAVDAWAGDLVELVEVARLVARDLVATDDAVAGRFRAGAS